MSGTKPTEPETIRFTSDGQSVPNNATLPFLLYRGGVDLSGTPDPEERIEAAFRSNGWGSLWRNGIYPYLHYHSMIHEVLGLARGRAKVRFGGNDGRDLDLAAGDVAILPAGTGHQGLWSSPDLVVIGGYPPDGRYDLCRGSKADYERALKSVPETPLPRTDPVFGAAGPLMRLWGG